MNTKDARWQCMPLTVTGTARACFSRDLQQESLVSDIIRVRCSVHESVKDGCGEEVDVTEQTTECSENG